MAEHRGLPSLAKALMNHSWLLIPLVFVYGMWLTLIIFYFWSE